MATTTRPDRPLAIGTADADVAYADLDPRYEQRLVALLANTRYSTPRDEDAYATCNADAWPTPYAVYADPALTQMLTDLALDEATRHQFALLGR